MKWLFSFFLVFSLVSQGALAQDTDNLSVDELRKKLVKVDSNIESTKDQIKNIRDANYLSDLYFVLAEFLVEKSRILYQLKIANSPNVPVEDLDFTFEKRPKEEAIEVYDVFLEKFPSESRRDRAMFFKAHELRELGRAEDMLKVYKKITRDFPNSQYWAESQLIIGDIYFEQEKDYELAIEVFKEILKRDLNQFTPLAYYKMGWSYINLNKFLSAYQSYEKAISTSQELIQNKVELKSDIRNQALQAMVWPYSEVSQRYIERVHSKSVSTLEHFRKLSFGYASYVALLKKLARRMKVKKRYRDAADAYFEYLRVSTDLEDKISTTSDLYQLLRQELRDVKDQDWGPILEDLLEQLEYSSSITKELKSKYRNGLEKVLRDLATESHKASKKNSQWEKLSYAAYSTYLRYFSAEKYSDALLYNKAGLGFRMGKAFQAGMDYEELARSRKRRLKVSTKRLLRSSLESYLAALASGGLDEYQKLQSRNAVRSMGRIYIKKYPKDRATPTILYNIGQSYYNERDFDKAIYFFKVFIKKYPRDTKISLAANQVLDAHNQKEDYKNLVSDGNWILSRRGLVNISLRSNIKEIVNQAKVLILKKQSGDYTKGSYAKNMLKMAQKFKGTDLGDKALYEAFILYRSQRSDEMYKPGEMLLKSHENSQYAKQAAGDMVRIALVTADFSRAAKYLEYFGVKYPKDSESTLFLKQAAEIRSLIKDYNGAKRIATRLGDYFSVAEMDYLSENWTSLLKTSIRVEEPYRSYWQAKALAESAKVTAARSLLSQKLLRIKSSGNKEIFAKSAYLQAGLAFEKYEKIRFSKSSDDQKVVELKTQGLNALTKVYSQVIQTGHPEMTLAALSGLGEIYSNFGKFLKKANMPKGLTAAQKKIFQDAIGQQVAVYTKQANEYYAKCLSTAKQARVYSKYLKYCSEKSSKIKLPSIEAEFSSTTSPQVANIRKALFDKPKDLELFQRMIVLLINENKFGDALATANRGLELFNDKPDFYSLMAIIHLHLGDFQEAGNYLNSGISKAPYDSRLKTIKLLMDKYFGLDNQRAQMTNDLVQIIPEWIR